MHVPLQDMLSGRLANLRRLWGTSVSFRHLAFAAGSRPNTARSISQRKLLSDSRSQLYRGCRAIKMSAAAPSAGADGVAQSQDLDALRKQLADLQVS